MLRVASLFELGDKALMKLLQSAAHGIIAGEWPRTPHSAREDLAQHMVVAGWEAIQEYKTDALRVVRLRMRSRGVDWLRKENLESQVRERVAAGDTSLPGVRLEQQEDYREAALEERVHDKLEASRKLARLFSDPKLTARQREVLDLLVLNDFDKSKVARELGVTLGAVNKTLNRIRAIIEEEEKEEV